MQTKPNRATISQPTVALIAVVLFLVFDFTALALNVWLSYRIEAQAVNINLAGRQRMLSQRMVKSLLLVQEAVQVRQAPDAPLAELQQAFVLFDSTLTGFAEGGAGRDGRGEAVQLAPLEGESGRLVAQARTLWLPYRQAVELVLGTAAAPAALQQAVERARVVNLELLALMNRLTSELEQITQHEAAQIRFFQGLAFLLALVNFGVALAVYALRVRRARLEIDLVDSIINRIGAGILVVADGAVVRANHTAEAMFGYTEAELVGRALQRLLGEGVGVHRDGHSFDCAVEVSGAAYEGRAVQVLTLTDVTEQRRAVSELSTLAYHDPLTGLPNRLLFDDRLQLELNHCLRRRTHLAVLFIDLDEFKPINDLHGHEVGDQVLRQVAHRLETRVRASDTVSRRGGDEFTLILVDIAGADEGQQLAAMLQQALSEPYVVNGIRLEIRVSIGIAIYPECGEGVEQLIRQADAAMYRAKREGAGGICSWCAGTDSAPEPG